jgi:short-subunit dehydrogenase
MKEASMAYLEEEDKSLSVLVVGASGNGYGAQIANTLESSGHKVFSMQRRPRFIEESATYDSELWCSADLEEPAQTIGAVRKLLSQKVSLDVIIHAALCSDEVEPEMITSFDLQKALRINVIEPLMLMHYLLEFSAVKHHGRAIFFMDPRNFDSQQLPLAVSKACVYGATTAFSQSWPATFEYMFLMPMAPSLNDSGDSISDTVLKVVEGTTPFLDKQTMYV